MVNNIKFTKNKYLLNNNINKYIKQMNLSIKF